MTETAKKQACYHPRCPCGPRVQKKCDELYAAGCIWRMSKETADFVQELWEKRRQSNRKVSRYCPDCGEKVVLVRFRGKWMELCTTCASLWYRREFYNWRKGEDDGNS